jgi:hypothetical protein
MELSEDLVDLVQIKGLPTSDRMLTKAGQWRVASGPSKIGINE